MDPGDVANRERQKVHILVIDDHDARVLSAVLPRPWLNFIFGKSTGSNIPTVTFTLSEPISLLDLCTEKPMADLITTMLLGWGLAGTN